jgi:hypothetical protein
VLFVSCGTAKKQMPIFLRISQKDLPMKAARNTIRHSSTEFGFPLNLKLRKKNVRMQLNGLSLRWAQNPAADLNCTLPILKNGEKYFKQN